MVNKYNTLIQDAMDVYILEKRKKVTFGIWGSNYPAGVPGNERNDEEKV